MRHCFDSLHYKPGSSSPSPPPAYLFKGQRIWRSIRLNRPENIQIFGSGGYCADVGLFEISTFGLLEKKLNAFASDDFSTSQLVNLNTAAILKALQYHDSSQVETFDAQGVPHTENVYTHRYRMSGDIKGYLLKEDWVINSHTGAQEKYIVAFAPLGLDPQSGTTAPLFWLYYEEWRPLLTCFEAKNFYGYERISFHTLFQKKYFISTLEKINNVFDRGLKDTQRGENRNLNNEVLKEQLLHAESDLFQY